MSTAAGRPRPPRDGVQSNTPHSVAHTRTLPYISGLWKSASLAYTRMYILALLLLLRRLCTFWCSILFSGRRSLVFLCCDTCIYRRFRRCPVVLRDIELSVSAQDLTCTAAREASFAAAASYSREKRAAACGVRQNVQTGIKRSENKITISCQSENTRKNRRTQNTPAGKSISLVLETPCSW